MEKGVTLRMNFEVWVGGPPTGNWITIIGWWREVNGYDLSSLRDLARFGEILVLL